MFAVCDPPFGGHYVATIIVATCLVNFEVVVSALNAWFGIESGILLVKKSSAVRVM